MEKKEKVFVLTITSNCECGQDNITLVFRLRSDARKKMNEYFENDVKEFQEDTLVVEATDDSYTLYEDGNFDGNHIIAIIDECEVQ